MVMAAPILSLKLDLSKTYTMSAKLIPWGYGSSDLNLGACSSKSNGGTQTANADANDSNLQDHFCQVDDNSSVADGPAAVAHRLINKLLRPTDQQRKPPPAEASADIVRLDDGPDPTAIINPW